MQGAGCQHFSSFFKSPVLQDLYSERIGPLVLHLGKYPLNTNERSKTETEEQRDLRHKTKSKLADVNSTILVIQFMDDTKIWIITQSN